jgi:hypothetical protein
MTSMRLVVALLTGLVAFTAPAQSAPSRKAAAPSAPAQSIPAANPDDTAKFLAGLPVAAGSPLEPLTQTPVWKAHAQSFGSAFDSFEKRQSSKIRAWSKEQLKSPKSTLLYMFSGPDFLYADAFFPEATTYVLAGLEPVGQIPDVSAAPPGAIPSELGRLRVSLRTVLSISFFITEHMKGDLRGGRFTGTLPVIYVFLARTGHTIKDVSLVYLDPATGEVKTDDAGRAKSGSQGVKFAVTDKGGRAKTVYYFSTNLANDGAKKNGLLEFATKLGDADAFVKSASYLMHGGGFTVVRDFLLDRASTIVQDDTGVPLTYFDQSKWTLEPYGNYVPPISIFSQRYQPKMRELFVKAKAPKIDFGIGYRHRPNETGLLVARKKS